MRSIIVLQRNIRTKYINWGQINKDHFFFFFYFYFFFFFCSLENLMMTDKSMSELNVKLLEINKAVNFVNSVT